MASSGSCGDSQPVNTAADSPRHLRRPSWAGRNYTLLTAAAVVTNLGSQGALIAAAFAVLESGGDGGYETGGTMTARAVARLYAALLGEVEGVQLVSPERLREMTAVAVDGVDQIFGNHARMSLGYSIGRPRAQPSAASSRNVLTTPVGMMYKPGTTCLGAAIRTPGPDVKPRRLPSSNIGR